MASEQKTKGVSLVKGPVGLIGLALLGYGITALIFGGHGFSQHAPNGAVYGKTWLGLEVNGRSGVLFIAGGLLLLLAAPLHWGAKGMSLIVGLALGLAAAIALAEGHGALGVFAANHLTELVWAGAAGLLIFLSLLPRVGGKAKQRKQRPATTRRPGRGRRSVERERTESPAGDSSPPQARQRTPVAEREGTASTAQTRSTTANGADTNGAQVEDADTNRARTRPLVAPASGTTPEGRDTTTD